MGEEIDFDRSQSSDSHSFKFQGNLFHKAPSIVDSIQDASDVTVIKQGLVNRFVNRTDYDKLCLSLLCGLPNEQELALNVCTILSNEGNYMLHLEQAPKLVDLLVAQTGIWPEDDYPLQMLHMESWKGLSGRNMHKFWRSTLDLQNEKLAPLLGMDIGEYDPYSILFNLEGDLGAHNVEGQRIARVALILHNLSFEKNNVPVLISNKTFMRFILLCIHSSWGNLRQTAYDTLSNLASAIKLSIEKDPCSRLIFHTVMQGILMPDRYMNIRSLDVLAQLCSYEENEDIIPSLIDIEVYQCMVSFLTVRDIMLLFNTLEALYALSDLGRYACDKIVSVHKCIGALVSLLTLEPNDYGPSGQINMKIVKTMVPAEFDSTQETSDTETTETPATTATASTTTTVVATVTTTVATPVSTATATSALVATLNEFVDAETFTVNWLKSAFELVPGKSVTRNELYSEYIAFCARSGRKDISNANVFTEYVKKTFPSCAIRRTESKGICTFHHDGLAKKHNVTPPVMKTASVFNTPTKASVSTSTVVSRPNQTPTTFNSILKSQLSSAPRSTITTTPIKSPLLNQKVTTTLAPRTTTPCNSTSSTLIKSLLASKVQQRTLSPQVLPQNVSKMVIYTPGSSGILGSTTTVVRCIRPGALHAVNLGTQLRSPLQTCLVSNNGRIITNASPRIIKSAAMLRPSIQNQVMSVQSQTPGQNQVVCSQSQIINAQQLQMVNSQSQVVNTQLQMVNMQPQVTNAQVGTSQQQMINVVTSQPQTVTMQQQVANALSQVANAQVQMAAMQQPKVVNNTLQMANVQQSKVVTNQLQMVNVQPQVSNPNSQQHVVTMQQQVANALSQVANAQIQMSTIQKSKVSNPQTQLTNIVLQGANGQQQILNVQQLSQLQSQLANNQNQIVNVQPQIANIQNQMSNVQSKLINVQLQGANNQTQMVTMHPQVIKQGVALTPCINGVIKEMQIEEEAIKMCVDAPYAKHEKKHVIKGPDINFHSVPNGECSQSIKVDSDMEMSVIPTSVIKENPDIKSVIVPKGLAGNENILIVNTLTGEISPLRDQKDVLNFENKIHSGTNFTIEQPVVQTTKALSSPTSILKSVLSDLEPPEQLKHQQLHKDICKRAPLLNGLLDKGKLPTKLNLQSGTVILNGGDSAGLEVVNTNKVENKSTQFVQLNQNMFIPVSSLNTVFSPSQSNMILMPVSSMNSVINSSSLNSSIFAASSVNSSSFITSSNTTVPLSVPNPVLPATSLFPNSSNLMQLCIGQTTLSGTAEVQSDQQGVVRLHIESPENSNQGSDLSSISDITRTLECASKALLKTNAECKSQTSFTNMCETVSSASVTNTPMQPHTTNASLISRTGQQIFVVTPSLNQSQLQIQQPNIKFHILHSVPKTEESVDLISFSSLVNQSQQSVTESSTITSASLKRPSSDTSTLQTVSIAKKPCIVEPKTSLLAQSLQTPTSVPCTFDLSSVSAKAEAKSVLVKSPSVVDNAELISKLVSSPKTIVKQVQRVDSPIDKGTRTLSGLSVMNNVQSVNSVQPRPAQSPVPQKSTTGLEFFCEWKNCGAKFKSPGLVFLHCSKVHTPLGCGNDVVCLWEGCDSVKRKRLSLLTHIQDWHCNEMVLQSQALRRKQLAVTGKSSIQPPQKPPPHPGYAPDAALLAIKRHALQYINPKELSEEKESILTKSIRITSALILRNLVTHSNLARSHVRRFEAELAYLAMSPVESARTLAQCLSQLYSTD